MNMPGLDRWLTTPPEDNSSELIEEEMNSLMESGAEHDPEDQFNFSEAISECSKEDWDTVKDFIAKKDWEALGRKLYFLSFEYMEARATNEATESYNRGALGE